MFYSLKMPALTSKLTVILKGSAFVALFSSSYSMVSLWLVPSYLQLVVAQTVKGKKKETHTTSVECKRLHLALFKTIYSILFCCSKTRFDFFDSVRGQNRIYIKRHEFIILKNVGVFYEMEQNQDTYSITLLISGCFISAQFTGLHLSFCQMQRVNFQHVIQIPCCKWPNFCSLYS